MSRKIILYIATSLDGFIAKESGAVDWLKGDVDNPDLDNGYQQFYDSIDTVVMGRVTYEQIINTLSPDTWPYEGKKCYVATRQKGLFDSNVEFITNDITKTITHLKEEAGKDIWLVGGGRLIDQFISHNLIDRYIITIIPTLLGAGIPLFSKENAELELELKLVETKSFDGMVELTYIRR